MTLWLFGFNKNRIDFPQKNHYIPEIGLKFISDIYNNLNKMNHMTDLCVPLMIFVWLSAKPSC